MSLRDDNIPLADDDPQGKKIDSMLMIAKTKNNTNVLTCLSLFSLLDLWAIVSILVIIHDDCNDNNSYARGKSQDSLASLYQNDNSSSGTQSLEPDINPDEQEEKARLISQVLELQNTLDGNYSNGMDERIGIMISNRNHLQIYHNASIVWKRRIWNCVQRTRCWDNTLRIWCPHRPYSSQPMPPPRRSSGHHIGPHHFYHSF